MSIVGGNSVVQTYPQFESPKDYLKRLSQGNYFVYEKIISCESNWNPKAKNGENGYKGRGLSQLIPSTQKYVSGKLGRIIDPYNPYDSVDALLWLAEKEGLHHWKQSASCHGYY